METGQVVSPGSPAGPKRMVLNWDILALLFPFIESRHTRSQVVRTCRTLYTTGVRSLLDQAIVLHFPAPGVVSQVPSFNAFILKEPERALLVHRLSFIGELPEGQAQHDAGPQVLEDLATVLRLCQNLTHLDIGVSESFFKSSDLRTTITGLVNLKDISFRHAGQYAFHAMQSMQACIRSASVSYASWHAEFDGGFIFPDPIVIFSPFQAHLERASMEYAQRIGVFTRSYKYLQVVRLEISFVQATVYSYPLQGAFPNVREFLWKGDCDPEDMDRLRGVSLTGLQIEGNYGRLQPWRLLHLLSCHASMAYGLALRCKVSHWDAAVIADYYACKQFCVVVGDIRPAYLRVLFLVSGLRVGDICGALRDLTDTPHVDITLDFTGCENISRDYGVDDDLADILLSLHTHSFIIITILYPKPKTRNEHMSELADPELFAAHKLNRAICELDIRDHVEEMIERAPSLQYLYVRFKHEQQLCCAWRILQEDGQSRVVQMREDESRDVLRVHDMLDSSFS